MRRLALLLGLLCLAGAGRARGAEGPQAGAAAADTGFQLLSAPDGADVFLDERGIGRTPLGAVIPAAPGEHRLRVVRPGFAPYSESFRVYPRKVASLLVEMVPVAGVLKVRASVPGARVFVDGRFAGDAPLELELETGNHTLRVTHRGFREEVFTVTSVPGLFLDKDVQLSEMSAHANLKEQISAGPARGGSRWWVWPVGILAAGAVATAIIVPTVYASRSPCQRVEAELCVPIHATIGAQLLAVRLPF